MPSTAKVMLDAVTGKSKGFGFVLFPTEDEGQRAGEAMNLKPVKIRGTTFTPVIFPSNHDGKAAAEASRALYVRNIPLHIPEKTVVQFLRSFGPLTYCALREDHRGNPVWVIYAEYETMEGSKTALLALHGKGGYLGSPVKILAKYADTTEAKMERRRHRRGESSGESAQNTPVLTRLTHDEGRNASTKSTPSQDGGSRGAFPVCPIPVSGVDETPGAIVPHYELPKSLPRPIILDEVSPVYNAAPVQPTTTQQAPQGESKTTKTVRYYHHNPYQSLQLAAATDAAPSGTALTFSQVDVNCSPTHYPWNNSICSSIRSESNVASPHNLGSVRRENSFWSSQGGHIDTPTSVNVSLKQPPSFRCTLGPSVSALQNRERGLSPIGV